MNFQVGDSVLVARKGVTGDANGMGQGKQWKNSWASDSMDANIGITFTIKDIDPELGAFFEEYDSNNLNGQGSFGYPLNVLEAIVVH